jgi:DNA polymerase-1
VHIVLRSVAAGVELVPVTDDGVELPNPTTVTLEGLPTEVARLDRSGPRWVWDDTARWYPRLLAAGVRVERCIDLRLSHVILRNSALSADSELARADPGPWDVAAATSADGGSPPDGALFDLDALIGDVVGDRVGGSEASSVPSSVASSVADRVDDGVAVRLSDGFAVRLSSQAPTPHSDPFPDHVPKPFSDRASDSCSDHDRVSDRATEPLPDPLSDPVAEFRRQRAAISASRPSGSLGLLVAAESAGALIAAEMRFAGLPWSASRHSSLLTELLGPRPREGERPAKLAALVTEIRDSLDAPDLNPDSPADLLRALRRVGLLPVSTRSRDLGKLDHPAILPLLEYKKLARLLSANGWHWLDAWIADGRFRPDYVPGGVVSGRWATSGGGALQLPRQVRGAVVPDRGWKLIVADAAQLEPRILAGLAGDSRMAEAGRGDLYEGIVASGAVATRAEAKVAMLGAMYGATRGDGGRLLPRLARAYPKALALVEAAARAGERGEVVSTRLGRSSPRPGETWRQVQGGAYAMDAMVADQRRAMSQSRGWGRFTRNFVVQGTAAEWALCWMAGLRNRLWNLPDPACPPRPKDLPDPPDAAGNDRPITTRPHLVYFLHDEVIVHAPAHLADAVAAEIRAAAAEAGRLLFGALPVDFPVTVAIVESYADAK